MAQLQLPWLLEWIHKIDRQYYGDHSLDSIAGAGCIERPALALVFINPTRRNLASSKNWTGLKAPWIGCNDLFPLLTEAKLISMELNEQIRSIGRDWTPAFAEEVYRAIATHGLYITNIVKWAGLDARLPNAAKIALYAPLLVEELATVRPRRTVLIGELTYKGVLRALGIQPPLRFTEYCELILESCHAQPIVSSLGELVPCYFPLGQGIRNRAKARSILYMTKQGLL